jgi:putative DNA primase/helicase
MGNNNTQAVAAKTNPAYDLIDEYADCEFRMVLLDRAKVCIQKGWPNLDPTPEEVKRNLASDGNVGWVAYGGIVGADLDTEIVQELAPHFLPDTLTSSYSAHLPSRYVYNSAGATFQKIAVDGEELLCLKALKKDGSGPGHQFVVPPSVHPEKGRYGWDGGWDPGRILTIEAGDLKHAFRLLGAAATIAMRIPPHGKHNFSLYLAGFLIRNGIPPEDVTRILLRAWDVRGLLNKSIEKELASAVRDTARKQEKGVPYAGGTKLVQEYSSDLPNLIEGVFEWKGSDGGEKKRYTLTDPGNGERLADAFGEKIRWVTPWKTWMVYNGKRWVRDPDDTVVRELAIKVARNIHKEVEDERDEKERGRIFKWDLTSQHLSRLKAMTELARGKVKISRETLASDPFDRDPYLLGGLNGTIDLRTCTLREHRSEDMITRIVPVRYDPDAQAPRFESFLRDILIDENGDTSEELIQFMQRLAGYSLTGSTEERCFAILHGGGANGKSTLVELLHKVLGDYSKHTAASTVLRKKYDTVSNDIAALAGARFVSASETEGGERLAEAKIKNLTGSDTITARFLFEEEFDFRPQFKLWLSTNNRPEIVGTDDAIWDRIRLIPFNASFRGSKADRKLPEKLWMEREGVLAWMVRGCMQWQEQGLGTAKEVAAATAEYRSDMDLISQFVEERCIQREGALTPFSDVFNAWTLWAEKERASSVAGKTEFGRRLVLLGFPSEKSGGVRVRRGLALRGTSNLASSSGIPVSRGPGEGEMHPLDEPDGRQ